MNKKLLALSYLLTSGVTFAQDSNWGVYLATNCDVTSSKGARSGADIFIPIRKSDTGMTFIDLRGKGLCQNGKNEDNNMSFAFGQRKIISDNYGIGANVSYDTAKSENGHKYSQVAAGVEVFTKNMSFKVNYMKANGENELGNAIAPYAAIENGQFMIKSKKADKEAALDGVSVELSKRYRLSNDVTLDFNNEVYHYYGSDMDSVTGITSDVEITKSLDFWGLDTDVYAYAGVDYNNQDDAEFIAGLGVRIHLGKRSPEQLDLFGDKDLRDMMSEGITRSSSPFISTKTYEEEAVAAVVEKYSREFGYLEQISDEDKLASEASDSTNGKTLLVLDNVNGAINITQDINLANNNVLIGAGHTVLVKGPNGETATLVLPGVAGGTIQGNNTNKVTMGSNTIVDDINIKDTQVQINDATNAQIMNTNISRNTGATTYSLLEVNDSNKITFSNINVQDISTFDDQAEDRSSSNGRVNVAAIVRNSSELIITDSVFKSDEERALYTHNTKDIVISGSRFETTEKYDGDDEDASNHTGVRLDIDSTDIGDLTFLNNTVLGSFSQSDFRNIVVIGNNFQSTTVRLENLDDDPADEVDSDEFPQQRSSLNFHNNTVSANSTDYTVFTVADTDEVNMSGNTFTDLENVNVRDNETVNSSNNTVTHSREGMNTSVEFDGNDTINSTNDSYNNTTVDYSGSDLVNIDNLTVTDGRVVTYNNEQLNISNSTFQNVDRVIIHDNNGVTIHNTVITRDQENHAQSLVDIDRSGNVYLENVTINDQSEFITHNSPNEEIGYINHAISARDTDSVTVKDSNIHSKNERALYTYNTANVNVSGSTLSTNSTWDDEAERGGSAVRVDIDGGEVGDLTFNDNTVNGRFSESDFKNMEVHRNTFNGDEVRFHNKDDDTNQEDDIPATQVESTLNFTNNTINGQGEDARFEVNTTDNVNIDNNTINNLDKVELQDNYTKVTVNNNRFNNIREVEVEESSATIDVTNNNFENVEKLEIDDNSSTINVDNNTFKNVEEIEVSYNLGDINVRNNTTTNVNDINIEDNEGDINVSGNTFTNSDDFRMNGNEGKITVSGNTFNDVEQTVINNNESEITVSGNNFNGVNETENNDASEIRIEGEGHNVTFQFNQINNGSVDIYDAEEINVTGNTFNAVKEAYFTDAKYIDVINNTFNGKTFVTTLEHVIELENSFMVAADAEYKINVNQNTFTDTTVVAAESKKINFNDNTVNNQGVKQTIKEQEEIAEQADKQLLSGGPEGQVIITDAEEIVATHNTFTATEVEVSDASDFVVVGYNQFVKVQDLPTYLNIESSNIVAVFNNTGSLDGIKIYEADHSAALDNNVLTLGDDGIVISETSHAFLVGNTLTGETSYQAVVSLENVNSYIENNTIIGNNRSGLSIDGTTGNFPHEEQGTAGYSLINNQIIVNDAASSFGPFGKKYAIEIFNAQGVNITSSSLIFNNPQDEYVTGIRISQSSRVAITDLTVQNAGRDFFILDSDNLSLTDIKTVSNEEALKDHSNIVVSGELSNSTITNSTHDNGSGAQENLVLDTQSDIVTDTLKDVTVNSDGLTATCQEIDQPETTIVNGDTGPHYFNECILKKQ